MYAPFLNRSKRYQRRNIEIKALTVLAASSTGAAAASTFGAAVSSTFGSSTAAAAGVSAWKMMKEWIRRIRK